MPNRIKKYAIYLLIVPLGALAGFLYWRYVGCNTGSCGITANWHTSTLFGGLLGYLISDGIKDKVAKGTKVSDEKHVE